MKIAVAAFAPVAQDGRVLRTCSALAEAGHEVHLVGYGGPPQDAKLWFHSLGPPPTRIEHLKFVLGNLATTRSGRLAWDSFGATWGLHRRCLDIFMHISPDAVHANDWPVLPAAVALKRRTGAMLVYDSHEFAREEHIERRLWRILYAPAIRGIEAAGIAAADCIVTVGPSIARLIVDAYRLDRKPLVVLNVPEQVACSIHPPGDRLELLYHGLFAPNRGIETLIQAMDLVTRPARLMLRGHGSPAYINRLKQIAGSSVAAGRVVFEPSVAVGDVVNAASRSDVGLVVPPLVSRQARYMMPNKLFEYLAAGLMVVVSAADDMATIVNESKCGVVLSDGSSQAIAAAIDSLTLDELMRCKQRALEFAIAHPWPLERKKLVSIYSTSP